MINIIKWFCVLFVTISIFLFPFSIIVKSMYPDKIPVSDRIVSCEKLGGKYHLYFNSVVKLYTEECEIQETEIKNF